MLEGRQLRPAAWACVLCTWAACALCAWASHAGNRTLPVVIWHGMGDSCCNLRSIGAVRQRIEEALPGTFVYSLATGQGAAGDTESSFFGNVNDQVENVCQALANMTELQDGYNGVGFSQGGQFMRAVVERCQHRGPRMHTLITMGGQHQGVMNVPLCWNPSFNTTNTYFCRAMQSVIGWGAYLPYIRNHLIQAQYFKDPWRMRDYLRHNTFLADINNEHAAKNPLYRENFASLERLVLVRFSEDYTVVPRDSAWFAFYDGRKLQAMRDTALYQEDWIGLRELDERGRIVFDEIPGAHMHFTLQYLEDHVVNTYLKGADLRSGGALSDARMARRSSSDALAAAR